MNSQLVEALLRSVQGSSVTEIEYEADGQRLRIVRQPHTASVVHPPAELPPSQADSISAAQRVCASMHGTFYRSSAPGEPPLVDIGQQVEAGQQLGLLEAMKMLHAVESEHTGRIVKIFVESAIAVEPGTPLFEIELSETGHV